MAKESDYRNILAELKAKSFQPVYFLMGEEPYFIDVITDYVENNILTDEQKDFNQHVLFGSDTTTREVITLAKGYPFGADKTVIIVKEAQNLRDIDNLAYYLAKPQPSTILLFAYKKKADARKKFISEVAKVGVLYESKPFYDNQLPTFVADILKAKKIKYADDVPGLLSDLIGNDLHRIVNEIDKLLFSIPKDTPLLTAELVNKFVSETNQYSNLEFRTAIINHDVLKANRIARCFAENPKQNPLQPLLSMLFNFFSNLMLYYYVKNQSRDVVAKELGISPYTIGIYAEAARNYNGWQTMRIIHELRRADAASKGVDNSSADEGEILLELVYHILHDKK